MSMQFLSRPGSASALLPGIWGRVLPVEGGADRVSRLLGSDGRSLDAVWERTRRLLFCVCCLTPLGGPLAEDGSDPVVRLKPDFVQMDPPGDRGIAATRPSVQTGSAIGPLTTQGIPSRPGLIVPGPNAVDRGRGETLGSDPVHASATFGHSASVGLRHSVRPVKRMRNELGLSSRRPDLDRSTGTYKRDTGIRGMPGAPGQHLLGSPVSGSQTTVDSVGGPSAHVDLGNGVWPWSRSASPVGRSVDLVTGQTATPETDTLLGAGHSTEHAGKLRRPVSLGGHSIAGTAIDRLAAGIQSDESESAAAEDAEDAEDAQAVVQRPFEPDPEASITASKPPAQWAIVRTDGPLGAEPQISADPELDRSCWNMQPFHWDASGLYHNPLYFEDRGLERYGHTVDRIQPLFSAASFAADFASLPVNAVLNPWCRSVYSLGYPRPGSPSPMDPKPPRGEFEYLSSGPVNFAGGPPAACVEPLPVEAPAQELYEPVGQ